MWYITADSREPLARYASLEYSEVSQERRPIQRPSHPQAKSPHKDLKAVTRPSDFTSPMTLATPSGHHKTSVLPEAVPCFFPQTASSVSDCSLTSCSQLIARHPRFAPDPDTRLQPPSANLADGENQTQMRLVPAAARQHEPKGQKLSSKCSTSAQVAIKSNSKVAPLLSGSKKLILWRLRR